MKGIKWNSGTRDRFQPYLERTCIIFLTSCEYVRHGQNALFLGLLQWVKPNCFKAIELSDNRFAQ